MPRPLYLLQRGNSYFRANTGINETTDVITLSYQEAKTWKALTTANLASHWLSNNEAVVYNTTAIAGDTAVGGLTNNQVYYVVNTTSTTFQLSDAPGGTPIQLTKAGAASNYFHSITPAVTQTRLLEMSNTNIKSWIGYLITNKLLASPGSSDGLKIIVQTNNATAPNTTHWDSIGSFSDTKASNNFVGAHPVSGADSLVATYYAFQNTKKDNSSNTISVRPAAYQNVGGVNQVITMTNAQLIDDVIGPIISGMADTTNNGFLTWKIHKTQSIPITSYADPSPGTWTADPVTAIANDGWTNSTSGQIVDEYKLFYRIDQTGFSTDTGADWGNSVFHPVQLVQSGTESRIQPMSNTDIENMTWLVGEYIRTKNILKYQFSTSTPSPGTWSNTSQYVDQRNQTTDESYVLGGGYTSTYTSSWQTTYTSFYTNTFTSQNLFTASAPNTTGYTRVTRGSAVSGSLVNYVTVYTGPTHTIFTGAGFASYYTQTFTSMFTGISYFAAAWSSNYTTLYTGALIYTGRYTSIYNVGYTENYTQTGVIYTGTNPVYNHPTDIYIKYTLSLWNQTFTSAIQYFTGRTFSGVLGYTSNLDRPYTSSPIFAGYTRSVNFTGSFSGVGLYAGGYTQEVRSYTSSGIFAASYTQNPVFAGYTIVWTALDVLVYTSDFGVIAPYTGPNFETRVYGGFTGTDFPANNIINTTGFASGGIYVGWTAGVTYTGVRNFTPVVGVYNSYTGPIVRRDPNEYTLTSYTGSGNWTTFFTGAYINQYTQAYTPTYTGQLVYATSYVGFYTGNYTGVGPVWASGVSYYTGGNTFTGIYQRIEYYNSRPYYFYFVGSYTGSGTFASSGTSTYTSTITYVSYWAQPGPFNPDGMIYYSQNWTNTQFFTGVGGYTSSPVYVNYFAKNFTVAWTGSLGSWGIALSYTGPVVYNSTTTTFQSIYTTAYTSGYASTYTPIKVFVGGERFFTGNIYVGPTWSGLPTIAYAGYTQDGTGYANFFAGGPSQFVSYYIFNPITTVYSALVTSGGSRGVGYTKSFTGSLNYTGPGNIVYTQATFNSDANPSLIFTTVYGIGLQALNFTGPVTYTPNATLSFSKVYTVQYTTIQDEAYTIQPTYASFYTKAYISIYTANPVYTSLFNTAFVSTYTRTLSFIGSFVNIFLGPSYTSVWSSSYTSSFSGITVRSTLNTTTTYLWLRQA